jgi:hypothetical protein
MLRYVKEAAAIILLLASATGVAAQGLEVEVTPMVGGQLFVGDLPGTFTLDDDAGSLVTFDGAEIEDALAVGGRIGLRHGQHFGFGATVLYSPTTLTEASGAETDLGVWVYGVDVTYFAPSPSPIAQPFVLAGIGGKTYDLEGVDAATDLMWNVGAGLDLQFHPRAALRLEARDYMSLFDPEVGTVDEELQHDLGLTAGFRFTVGPGAP